LENSNGKTMVVINVPTREPLAMAQLDAYSGEPIESNNVY